MNEMQREFERWFDSQDWSAEEIPVDVFKVASFSAWKAAWEAARRWIPASEGMKKPGKLYVVYDDLSERVWYMEWDGRKFTTTDSDGECPVTNDNITLYQSAPEPPEE